MARFGGRALLDGLASIALIAASVVLVWANAPKLFRNKTATVPLPRAPLSIDGVPTKGSPSAPVVMIAYSDFQCPYCSIFAKDIYPLLDQKYVVPGKVRLAFRHFPIESTHPFAFRLAEGAECARRQGRFWEMHDAIFGASAVLRSPEDVDQLAGAARLDTGQLASCLKGEASDRVREDMASGRSIGVRITPSFYVGRVDADGRVVVKSVLTGAKPADVFEAALDGLLATTK